MHVLNDIVGDEDDDFLIYEHFKLSMQEAIYQQLISTPTYSTKIVNIVYDKPIRYVSFDVEIKRE